MDGKKGKGACVCVCEREQGGSAGPSKECVRKVNVFAFWHTGGSVQKKEGQVCSLLCQRALTQKQTLGVVAHLSEVTALPLSASHSLVIPLAV